MSLNEVIDAYDRGTYHAFKDALEAYERLTPEGFKIYLERRLELAEENMAKREKRKHD